MATEHRRQVLRGGARLLAAAVLGGVAGALGLRRRGREAPEEGYCHRAGRCGGCETARTCETFQAMHGGIAGTDRAVHGGTDDGR